MNVAAVFDIGKTNKKLFLFDEEYRIVSEQSVGLASTTDEDGDACEDLKGLTEWIREVLSLVRTRKDVKVRAVSFSAYGASLVHLGEEGRPVAPLYNYLKPYPEDLRKQFYEQYGGEGAFSLVTASPILGSLNSGMQLYRIKQERPGLFSQIRYSLHLPQYCSYLVAGKAVSDITSIGCHTGLWDFPKQQYHEWVYREGVIEKLAPVVPSGSVVPMGEIAAGVGLHDSSAAMIPYLESFREPFVLISTGTWCITMNPFDKTMLTVAELQQDCLCYMSYRGRAVKASRLFAGFEHEQQVKRIADHFQEPAAAASLVRFDPACVEALRGPRENTGQQRAGQGEAVFRDRDLSVFTRFEEAYHFLMMDIMQRQVKSTRLVLNGGAVQKIFVDGGFGKNDVYMHLLARAFPEMEVYAAAVPQATAMGAALAIHAHWNGKSVPEELVALKRYF